MSTLELEDIVRCWQIDRICSILKVMIVGLLGLTLLSLEHPMFLISVQSRNSFNVAFKQDIEPKRGFIVNSYSMIKNIPC